MLNHQETRLSGMILVKRFLLTIVTKWINWVWPKCFQLDGHDGLQRWRQIFTAPPSKSEDLAWGLALTNNHLAEVTLYSFPACL